MTLSRWLSLATFLTCPLPVLAASPTVEITRGTITAPSNQLYDQAINPLSGSLTAPSVVQTQEKLAHVPGAVKLVTAEHYADTHAVDLKDMLSSTPGVFAEKRFGEEVRLSIRGSGLGRGFHLRGITLLQDGVPINLVDGSGDFQEIDPLSTRMIEVYKGGNGLAYGASSLGGAINVITPTGQTAIARNELQFEGGSFGGFRTHGSVARVIGQTDFYASLTGSTSEGFRDQSAQEKGRFNGNIGYRFNDTAETRFYVSYNNLNQEVPGTLNLRTALDHPRKAPLVNKGNDYARDITSVRLANKTSFTLGQNTLDVGAYANIKSLFHPIFQVLDQDSQTYGAFARLSGHTTLAAHENRYSLTLNGMTGHTDALQYTNVRGSRGVKTADGDQDASQFDVYGENQFYVTEHWSLVTGAQYLYAVRDFTNNLVAANSDRDTYEAVNPKLGVIRDIGRDAQIFANVTRSSEVPTFSELVQAPIAGFVPLDMQRAWTVEAGTRGQHDRYAWDLTAYRSWIDGELLNFTTTQPFPPRHSMRIKRCIRDWSWGLTGTSAVTG